MEPKTVLEWKMLLEGAHNSWRSAGIIPDERGQIDVKYSMLQYLDAYRGDFPPVLNGAMESVDQMAGNLTFSLINSMVAQLSARTPDPILRPTGGPASGREARKRAWLNERVVETMVTERKFKEECDLALLCAVLCGFGIVRHGFTPDVEYEDDNGNLIARYKNQTPDMPWLQFVRPWHVRIDPMVNSFDPTSEPRWVAFYNVYRESQIKRNPNLIFRKDLTPTYHYDLRPKADRKSPLKAGDEYSMPMYEEWVIYDAETRKFFGVSPGSDSLIREEKDWPFEWGQLPYSWLAFNEQIDSPFPIPFPRMFADEQQLYNKIWTIINALVSRVRRIIFANKSALEEGDLALLKTPESLVEIIETNGSPSEAAQEIGFGTIDGQLIGLLYQLKEQIREVLGVSSFDRGQRANVETAAEANNIAAGGAVSRGRTQERYEGFWSNVIRVSHRTFLQSEDARALIIPIIGKTNLQFLDEADRENGFVNVSLEDLAGEFSYSVKLDSTLKTDPNTELGRFATGYNLLGGVQSKLIDQRAAHEIIMELAGQDPQRMVIDEKTAQAMMQAEQGGEGEEQPQGESLPATAQQSVANLRPVLGGQ